jgi:hypothetical protein
MSVTSICNMALANIGKASTIASIDEVSAEARACKMYYDIQRKAILQSYPWRFADKIASMAELVTNDRDDLWAYAYTQASDCLKIKRVSPYNDLPRHDPGEVYAASGLTVYTNCTPAYLFYTYDAQDAGRFSADFEIALSWYLSISIAVPLTRDIQIRDNAFKMAMVMQSRASANDANNNPDVTEDDWTASRLVAARD